MSELKQSAAEVAAAMQSSSELSPAVRAQFIAVRDALYRRGIFDPVLVRFDSATAPKASVAEVAAQLTTIAEGL